MQLSRDPPSHIPPPLVQTNLKPKPIPKPNNPSTKNNNIPQLPENEVEIEGDMHDHAVQFAFISKKLESQKDLPKEQRRIYSDIVLPELSHPQPREVYDMVKQQFKAAEWQPVGEKRETPKPTKKPTPSPTTTTTTAKPKAQEVIPVANANADKNEDGSR